METHVKVVAWIYLVLGALGLATGLLVWGVLGGIGGLVEATGDPDAEVVGPVMGWIGALVFWVIAIMSLPSVAAGWGLLQKQEWARILAIILSALNLLGFPFGTAIGVYGLWVLLNKETAPMFSKA